jgi:hypothetical protein
MEKGLFAHNELPYINILYIYYDNKFLKKIQLI